MRHKNLNNRRVVFNVLQIHSACTRTPLGTAATPPPQKRRTTPINPFVTSIQQRRQHANRRYVIQHTTLEKHAVSNNNVVEVLLNGDYFQRRFRISDVYLDMVCHRIICVQLRQQQIHIIFILVLPQIGITIQAHSHNRYLFQPTHHGNLTIALIRNSGGPRPATITRVWYSPTVGVVIVQSLPHISTRLKYILRHAGVGTNIDHRSWIYNKHQN